MYLLYKVHHDIIKNRYFMDCHASYTVGGAQKKSCINDSTAVVVEGARKLLVVSPCFRIFFIERTKFLKRLLMDYKGKTELYIKRYWMGVEFEPSIQLQTIAVFSYLSKPLPSQTSPQWAR